MKITSLEKKSQCGPYHKIENHFSSYNWVVENALEFKLFLDFVHEKNFHILHLKVEPKGCAL
jgi:hypothetical protein